MRIRRGAFWPGSWFRNGVRVRSGAALDGLELDDSGLFFCSIAPASAKLADLVPTDDVPAILDSSFKLKKGLGFFTTLKLTQGAVKPLAEVLKDAKLSLYANVDGKALTVIANAGAMVANKAFTFDGFTLEWDLKASDVVISASTGGELALADAVVAFLTHRHDRCGQGRPLLDPGRGRLGRSLRLHQVDRQELRGRNLHGASAEGVTLALSGDFQFTPDDGNQFDFGIAVRHHRLRSPDRAGLLPER